MSFSSLSSSAIRSETVNPSGNSGTESSPIELGSLSNSDLIISVKFSSFNRVSALSISNRDCSSLKVLISSSIFLRDDRSSSNCEVTSRTRSDLSLLCILKSAKRCSMVSVLLSSE